MNKKLLDSLTDKSYYLADRCEGRCKHITYILKRNKILSRGWNLANKTDAWAHRHKYKYPYIHSELAAIRNFKYVPAKLKGLTLVNIRWSRDKEKLLMARPCSSCLNLIRVFEISEVWYSIIDGFENL